MQQSPASKALCTPLLAGGLRAMHAEQSQQTVKKRHCETVLEHGMNTFSYTEPQASVWYSHDPTTPWSHK
jgi:hypothetical protein